MTPISIITNPSREEWDRAMGTMHLPHAYVSWEWGEAYGILRPEISPFRLLATDGVEPVGLFQGFEWVEKGKYRGMIAGGSGSGGGMSFNASATQVQRSSGYAELLKEAEKRYLQTKAQRLLIYTQIDDQENHPTFSGDVKRTLRHNPVIDLPDTSEIMLSQYIHQKTRNQIRKTEKMGMEVDNANADDLQTYYELQKEVHRRHNLPARKLNTLEILHEMWNLLAPNGMMRMYKARFEGETVACAAVFRFGKSVFYRGGVSNEKGRTLSANTALQWKIICDAIQDGIGFYNMMGGSEDPDASNFNITQFKLSFGARMAPFYRYSASGPRLRRWMTTVTDTWRGNDGGFPLTMYP